MPPSPYTPGELPDKASGETISELELGVDALFINHLWLEATWFRRHSSTALVGSPIDIPTPVGDWHTTGVDAALYAQLVRSPRVDWSARLDVSAFSNRVGHFGGGYAFMLLPGSTPLFGVDVRNVPGHPIGGIWGYPTSVQDANRDGIISKPEVIVDPNLACLGSSIPTRELGFSSDVALHNWKASVLLDYRGGFKQANGTEDARCKLESCGALYDGRSDTDSRLDRAIAARNLLTLSGYSGLDPEVNYTGQLGLSRGELNTVPLPRTLIIRLDIQR